MMSIAMGEERGNRQGVVSPPTLRFARCPVVRTSSIDEARHVYGNLVCPIEVERTEKRTPFEWHSNRAVVGPIAISDSWYRSGIRAHNEHVGDIFSLLLPIVAGGEVTHAGTTAPFVPGHTGAITSTGRRVGILLESGYQGIQITVPGAVMESALSALTGTTGRTPLGFAPRFSITSSAGASITRIVRFLIEEADRDESVLVAPLVAAKLADALAYSLLMGQPHNHAALLQPPPRPAEPRYVGRVAEYLEAHAAEPISLADLAEVASASVRSIQAGFRAHRGCSPMEFLRERRLELARRRLLCVSGTTVARIALDCGFEHVGRFSLLYRVRFGESPTDTRRRTGGTAAGRADSPES